MLLAALQAAPRATALLRIVFQSMAAKLDRAEGQ
jgi:hypothetical protein